MATPTPRVRVPAVANKGDIIEIKTLISHDMETGQRKGPDGQTVPREIIRQFEVVYNRQLVFSAEWYTAVSANPFQSFCLRAESSGQIDFAWTDDDGSVYRTSAMLTVT